MLNWFLVPAYIITNEFANFEPLPCLSSKPPPEMCFVGDGYYFRAVLFCKISTHCKPLRAGLEFSSAQRA